MEVHDELSNAEILTLVVYLLDGSVTPVDLEDAAIEAFKLAPKKFSWIKHDDRIDLRIVEYALRSACRPNVRYLKGSNKHGYMLTQTGLEWAKKVATKDQSTSAARKSSPTDLIEKEKARLQKTLALEKFNNGETEKITVVDFREFTRVNDYFPEHLRKQRYDKIENVVKDDVGLRNVWKFLKSKFIDEEVMSKKISVKSHVSRDFLQNADYFNTLPKVVWEYVSNSLDNGREDTPITVAVEIRKEDNLLTIADNGVGMSRGDLEHFFTMHGENIQRKKGKRVRGRFGTGKSAAFGIAKSLTIETRQNGKRNVVSLHVDDIKKATSGESFEVNEIVIDKPTSLEDGTIIEIREFLTSRLDIDTTINYIEKHLARYRSRATVTINEHVCKFMEPPAVQVVTINAPSEIEKYIGSPDLTIKVAPFSLDQDERGIDILSDGIWHETTLGDITGKELSERIFGEVDIPILEQVDDPIAPFDNTRNNLLNRANPRVVILIGWISQEIEKVRQQLVQEERERRKTEQAKKLEQEAQRMADILNEDFKNLMIDLEVSRRVSGKSKSKTDDISSTQGAILPGGGSENSEWRQSGQLHGNGHGGKNPPGEGDIPRDGPSLIPGNSQGSPKEAKDSGSKRRSGLFSIEFVNSTAEYQRSKYKRDEHKILINLDHPQISFALKEGGGSQESRLFLSMVYEVAAVEYAQAIPFERIQQNEQVDAAEALFEVGYTIDLLQKSV